MVKTVIFDIGNELVDVDFVKYVARYTDDPQLQRRLLKATAMSPLWDKLDKGEEAEEDVIRQFVALDPEIEDLIRESLRNTKGMIELRQETVPMILGLKKSGYQVLALSNYPKRIHEDDRQVLNFLEMMDGHILSYKEKVIKPEPEIYALLQSRYGFQPSECVFIDDKDVNLDAADAAGWNTILYKNYDQMKKELLKLGVHFEPTYE